MNVIGIPFNNISMHEAVNVSLSFCQGESKSNVFFLNSDCLYKALKDEEYKSILINASLVLPDGIGLKLIGLIFGVKIKDNCNGSDFSPLFIQEVVKRNFKIFLLGGRENVSFKAANYIKRLFPEIQVVGIHHGFFTNDEDVINKINSSKADILFVGMGVPLQERWIHKNREKLNPTVCLGVGALFDYLSGSIPRAPMFMRSIHLEWLWRIFMEPRRMIKRYIIDGSKLCCFVIKYKLFGNKFEPRRR